MSDPVGLIFGGLGRGRETSGELFTLDFMTGAREQVLGPIDERREEMGLPPLMAEPPSPMSFGEAARGNIRGFFGGDPAEPTPFTNSWTEDKLRSAMQESGFSEDEIENYIGGLSLQQRMAIQYRRPRALLADPLWTALPGMNPTQMAQAERQYLGQPEPPEPPEYGAATSGSVVFNKATGEWMYQVPFKTDMTPANAINNTTGEVRWGSVEEIAELIRGGGWRRGPQESYEETRQLDPLVERDIVKNSIQLLEELDNLKVVSTFFDPDYLTLQGRIQKKLLTWMDIIKATNPDQQAYLFKRSIFESGVATTLNATIKRITGAQMSAQEAERIILETIKPDDTPSVFKGKLYRLIYFNGLSIARNQLLVEKGVVEATQKLSGEEWSKLMSFEGVRQDLLNKAGSILDSYEAQGKTRAEAIQLTEQQMMDRYGVHPQILTGEWMEENIPLTLKQLQALPPGETDRGSRLSAEEWKAAQE